MDADRFDTLTRRLTAGKTRRGLVRGIAGALSLRVLAAMPDAAGAKKKKKKKLKLNQFGCVNVGGKCRGKDSKCCSGICKGKKPKKGKKDKSRCVAHDEGTCVARQDGNSCENGLSFPCTTSAGQGGGCFATTGNAGYCAALHICFPCQKDADCIGVCGSQAACIPCAFGCEAEGGTACGGPSIASCLT